MKSQEINFETFRQNEKYHHLNEILPYEIYDRLELRCSTI